MSDRWWSALGEGRTAETLRAVVSAWQPDDAALYDDAVVHAVRVVGRTVRIGYATWLSTPFVPRPPRPAGYTAERFAGGRLFVQKRSFDPALAVRAQAALVAAGRIPQVPLEQPARPGGVPAPLTPVPEGRAAAERWSRTHRYDLLDSDIPTAMAAIQEAGFAARAVRSTDAYRTPAERFDRITLWITPDGIIEDFNVG